MRLRALLLLAITVLSLSKIVAVGEVDEAPYFGDWENDRGDTLQITSDSITVNDEKPVRYDDITEDSDETFFVLQIKEKDSSESSYFGGNFLRITFGKDPDHFTMSIYKTLPDTLKKENEVKHIEWSAPAVEKEETDETDQPKEEQPKEEPSKEEQKKDEEKKSDQPKADQSPEKPSPSPSAP
jgi:outer membrane biosynthesis protein TonB